jgi:hypothetical protein
MRNAYKVFVGKPEWKRSLGRHRCKWKANIKMDIWEIVFEGVDWIHPRQYMDQCWALVTTAMNRGIS